ncbi:MAG: hypothetical protein AAF871_08165 [Pseudomonadota bacterium]
MADARDHLDALEDLLERERALLLSGSLDGLARLADEKTRLLTKAPLGSDPRRVARLRWLAERNGKLLEAAAKGIRSVAARLQAVRDGPEPLSTYGSDGGRHQIGPARRSVEKRA